MDKPKVFILEDSEDRMVEFRKRFKDKALITHSDKVEEAKKLFSEEEFWDLILLDHDLGGEAYVNSNHPNTGAAFCRWLAKKNEVKYPSQIVIHSANQIGAKEMAKTLREAQMVCSYHPYIWLEKEFGQIIKI